MILDTNALSDFADRDADLLRVLPSDRPWSLPTVVIGEYRFGLLGSRERAPREAWLTGLISVLQILDITADTTTFYASVRDQLKTDNRRIPPNDAWIAALALQHQLPIASRDHHFDLIQGVRRVTWRP